MSADPFDPADKPDSDPLARTVIVPSPRNMPPAQGMQPGQARPVRTGFNHLHDTAIPKSGSSFDLSAYSNPLIRAAGPILMSAMQLKESVSNSDPEGVRARMSGEMRAFDHNAKNFGVTIPQTNAARYILCTFIDEVVMGTPWGAQSGWSGTSLLSEFYGETFGGEKVFVVIDRALKETNNYALLLELAYIIIGLGFEGQYKVRNKDEIKKVQARLYQALRTRQLAGDKALSPHWRGEEENRSDRLMKLVPLWLIFLYGLAALGVLYAVYSFLLNDAREPVYRIVGEIEKDAGNWLAELPPPDVAPFDLEARLQPYVGNGVDVSIDDGVATISMTGRTNDLPLFESGSYRVHKRADPILDRIASVLNDIPGDVTLTGHTDAQGRIQSNRILSRRRADEVRVQLHQRGIAVERIETRGYGSSEPRVVPERNESDRSRNRRVEVRFRVPDNMPANIVTTGGATE